MIGEAQGFPEETDSRTGIQTIDPRGVLRSAALCGAGSASLISALSTSVLSVVVIIIVLLLTLGI